MEHLFTVENLIALLTLTSLEVVLGIDNIVFLAILTGKLPQEQQRKARLIGLSLAMIMRILLLLGIKWVMGLTAPLFTVIGHAVSGRDIILLVGGLFLLAKATHEIHERIEGGGPHGPDAMAGKARFSTTIAQIVAIDLVFSLDSVITAVGMAKAIEIMIAAVVIAVIVMMVFASSVSCFVERHPTIKMLALAFLILIGVMLIAEGLHRHIERGYIYFAMAFSLVVEMLNIKASKRKAAQAAHA
jgi:predicted tellurium resistance membrane protein TerC